MVSDPRRSVHNTARIAVVGSFLLILAGGLVTSRDAGLSVPDWPLAFGQLNPPGWWRIESIRTEHGHRIIAFAVALWMAFLGWRVYRLEDRTLARRLAAAGAAVVLIQALLGGLRVLRLSLDLAMVHGLVGQLFFALLCALAVVTAPEWETRERLPNTRRERCLTMGLVVTVILQLALGISIRHLGAAARPLAGTWLYYAHVGTAGLVLSVALDLNRGANATAKPSANTLLATIAAQIVLGIASFIVTESMAYDRQATMLQAWLPTLHVGCGAALLGASLTRCLHAWRESLMLPLPRRQVQRGGAV
ncbi:MAG: COX15/CtaA family protein [Deltaproteobacteria bacterium]|nr:COX15/CtaA family protein [Deltaproteobacteria bacterium]